MPLLGCWLAALTASIPSGELPGAEAGAADGQQVTASIHVPPPPAGVYVLGDEIPLVWRFTNLTTDPLAMLWEGCCRLNGKLTVTRDRQGVGVLPPGAASFHSFSKAEVLPPGQPMEFSSRLADWVRLPEGGGFEIGGHYTGVLPSQRPQLPDGAELWTGTAEAAPTQIRILSVPEYLAERPERSQRRDLELFLTGPDRLPPVAAADFTVTLRNLKDSTQGLDWPGTVQLWLVNERGWRLEKGIRHLQLPGEHLELPARGEIKCSFSLSSADLNGEPFGELTVFLDLGAAADATRVPSNALRVTWNLDTPATTRLLNEAAGGPAAGMRNPPLKLLRQYLPALTGNLRSINPMDLANDRARELRDDLLFAACLRPLSPEPGPAWVPLKPVAGGNWIVSLPDARCGLPAGVSAQVEKVTSVRRHLGWDITLEAMPEPSTRVGDLFALANVLAAQREQLAAPLTWRQPQSGGAATNSLQFSSGWPAANIVVWLTRANGGTRIEATRKPRQPGRPVWLGLIAAGELNRLERDSIPDAAALTEWLKEGTATPQPAVVADESISCAELLRALQPLVDASLRISLVQPEPAER